MIKLLFALAGFVAAPPVGEVAGDVRVGEQYVAEAELELKCGTEIVKGKTDKSGSFRLSAKGSGKCSLTVAHDGQKPAVDVIVFETPARYRLLLEKKGDAWTLRRV